MNDELANDDYKKELYFSHYSKKTLDDFKKFHANNPHIYEEFKKLAYRMKETGRRKYSSKMIINVLRWETDLRSDGDEFKINDRFQSIYGRLLAYHDPIFEEFFEFRIRTKNDTFL
jgi:hypothetical protein